jgi:hypothetical protein
VTTTWSGDLGQDAPLRPPGGGAAPFSALRQLRAPLDGTLIAQVVDAPPGTTMTLLDGAGHRLATATDVLRYTICGTHSLALGLTGPASGRFSIRISSP